MTFMDDEHRKFYETCLNRTSSHSDPYRKALFYTLGLIDDTRCNINSLYDFDGRGIVFDGLTQGWQTGTSMKVTRMAFNLYNGFIGDMGEGARDDPALYSPDDLFCTGLMAYFFEAIKLRYPEYFRKI